MRRLTLSSPARSISASGLPPVARDLRRRRRVDGLGQRGQQQVDRRLRGETGDLQAGHSGQLRRHVRSLAAREHQGRRLGAEPAGDEGERVERLGVEQVGVVDRADHRGVLARRGEQAQHAQTDEEPVRRRTGGHPGSDRERLLVPLGQRGQVVAQRDISRCRAAYGRVDSASKPSARSRRRRPAPRWRPRAGRSSRSPAPPRAAAHRRARCARHSPQRRYGAVPRHDPAGGRRPPPG